MSYTKSVLWFIAGITAGAVAGILLAKDAGSDTRKKIMEKLGTATDDSVTGAVHGIINKLENDAHDEISRDNRKIVPKMNNDIL